MSTTKKTALLIDQDTVGRESFARMLRAAGWQVYEAEEGDGGLAHAIELEPDIVFCDVLVPGCNGFQMCRVLRSWPETAGRIKIVLTSASDYAVHRENAAQAGADDFLVKPILQPAFTEFLRRLHANEGPTEILRLDGKRRSLPPAADTAGLLAAKIPLGELTVRFWGVRGSIPTPGPGTLHYGGNTACVEVRADGQLIVLDAGTGIRGLGLQLAEEFRGLPLSLTLLISHTHWDHIQGLPFFDAAYNPRNRLRILGCEGAREGLLASLSSQMESPYFPVGWQELPGHVTIDELKESKFKIGSIEVETIFLNHPGVCIGYRLNTLAGSVAYLPDNEPYQRYKFHTDKGEHSGSTEFLDFARRMDQRLIDFIRDVDVVILDSQYDAMEYQTRAGWGHGCVDDVVALALNANAKRLFLFHHDPSHDDAKISQMTEWARGFVSALGETLQVDGAQEGLEIRLTAQADANAQPQIDASVFSRNTRLA